MSTTNRPAPAPRAAARAAAACLAAAMAQASASPTLTLLDRDGRETTALTDGDRVTLRLELPAAARRAGEVEFRLDGATSPVARCTLRAGARGCRSEALAALGWHWRDDGSAAPERTLSAHTGGARAETALRVAPRPVVLVHGFLSNAGTWHAYTGADGFLAAAGLRGFAVGDGQADGTLRTGDIARPRAPTATLSENAAALARYVAGVKAASGAQMVDLVAHSMGGLIARYYIARLMPQRDVAQLLMLGSPHGGSDCSGLPSALRWYLPAALELRPAYQQRIFGAAAAERHGVPFHTLAGDAIVEAFKAPCTGVPSDLVVGVDSAAAIAGELERMPVLHTAMTASQPVFGDFVLPRLRRGPADFARGAGPAPLDAPPAQAQFTRIYTGRVDAGASVDVAVDIDRVAVAGFALFDPSRSLAVTVTGASGNVIALSPDRHGLIRVDDPRSLLHLGYGFDRPAPGPWRVRLAAPADGGGDYALSVRVVGGAWLDASTSTATPRRGEPVALAAALDAHGAPVRGLAVEAVVHQPDGTSLRLPLAVVAEARAGASFSPTQAGLHSVDVAARAVVDGLATERTALLVLDVQR